MLSRHFAWYRLRKASTVGSNWLTDSDSSKTQPICSFSWGCTPCACKTASQINCILALCLLGQSWLCSRAPIKARFGVRKLTRNGEGSLCYIGGYDNKAAACGWSLKHLCLRSSRQVGIQGQHMDRPCALLITYLPLALPSCDPLQAARESG